MNSKTLSEKEQKQFLKLVADEEEYFKYNQLKLFFQEDDYIKVDGSVGVYGLSKYPKFKEFYRAGKYIKQRAVVAANRVGKTKRALAELVLHCTGDYPDNWEGQRYDRPLTIIMGADRGETAKRIFQPLLLGEAGEGTGLIPKQSLVKTEPLPGIAGGIGTYFIKGKFGISKIVIITYNSGRTAFEGFKADIIYLDEEAPRDILSECLLRTMTVKDSMVISTFTPDSGLSDTFLYFSDKDNESRVSLTNVTWDDVPHLSEVEKKNLLASMSPQERECRSKGIPYLGRGKIYLVAEDNFIVKPFDIPSYWPRVFGLDVGFAHPTAIVWAAYDRESDIVYIYSEHRLAEAPPSTHANAILARGSWIPGVIDTSAGQKASGSAEDGTRLIEMYRKFSIYLTFVRKGKGSVEEGILEVSDRLESGRLKVFSNCVQWIDEYRLYRRDDNSQIVKTKDDLMDATRYLIRSGLYIASIEPREDRNRAKALAADRNDVVGY